MKHENRANFFQALAEIERKLRDLEFPWALTGSMNHFFQGVNIFPMDIDLISTRTGVFAIEERLKEFGTQKSEYHTQPSIRSYYGIFKVHEIQMEVMGEIENLLHDGQWYGHDRWMEHILCLPFENTSIPCLTLNYEYEVYTKLGFLRRAKLILEKIENFT